MQKQLLSLMILFFVGTALTGCIDVAEREIDAASANGEQTVAQEGDVTAARETTIRESGANEEVPAANTLIQLSDPLDEPEYYCIDVPGFRQSLNLDGALTAHTCKPNADDEMFTVNHPAEGQLYMPAYERCMEARSAAAGAELSMLECSDSPLQRFTYHADGSIQLQSNDAEALCIAVAGKAGEPTGGPSHLRRDLLLQPCANVFAALSQWAFPGPTVP